MVLVAVALSGLAFGCSLVLYALQFSLVKADRLAPAPSPPPPQLHGPSSPDEYLRMHKLAFDEVLRTLEYQERRLQNLRTRSSLALTAAIAVSTFFISESIDASVEGERLIIGIVATVLVATVSAIVLSPFFSFEFTANGPWFIEQANAGKQECDILAEAVAFWQVRCKEHQGTHSRMAFWTNVQFLGLVVILVYWGIVLYWAPGSAPTE